MKTRLQNASPLATRSLAVGMIVLSMGLLASCKQAEQAMDAHQMPPPEVAVAKMIQQPVTLKDTFTGTVVAPETVEIRPRVSGYINRVVFAEGSLVQAGDLLFEIDPRLYQARVASAKASLAQANSDLMLAKSRAERAKSLFDRKAISQEDFDQRKAGLLGAQAGVDAAQAALRSAELDLEYTEIRAPIAGRIGRAQITKGNLANADQSILTTLVSVNPMYVYFDVDEASVATVDNLGSTENPVLLQVGLTTDQGFPHRAQLNFIDNQLNTRTGTLRYRAELNNDQGLFKPGQFVRVQMPIASLNRALLLDRKAVLTDQDRRFVYTLDQNNTVVRREVTLGRVIDQHVVVEKGLAAGDQVVISGHQKIFGEGMPVVPTI